LLTFAPNESYETIHTLLNKIIGEGIIANVKYHTTTGCFALYLTASYERFLQGAEDLQLKKQIKSNYGGGIKQFIFDEQEFYENIEEEDLFLNTEEKQSIIYSMLSKIVSNDETEKLVLGGQKVPNGRKLSNKSYHIVQQ
jgi:anoctamin-8